MELIPAKYYYDIYLVFTTLLSIPCFLLYSQRDSAIKLNIHKDRHIAFWTYLFFALFIGLRPVSSYFGDMTQYLGIYLRWFGSFEFNWDVDNLLYDNTMYWFASHRISPTLYYIYVAFVYFGGMYVICRKLFSGNTYAVFLVCIGAFSTFAAGTNGIKAGMAASVFLISLAFNKKLLFCIPLALLSWTLHHSMQLPIVALIISLFFYKKAKYFIIIWLLCLLISALHITFFQEYLGGLTDETGAGYLLGDRSEDILYDKGGFRIDFVIYSVMPILMGWYAIFKKRIEDRTYNILFCTYCFSNAIWLLCIYVPFTNRIAYLSWFMYPIVLVYPLFLEQWGKNRYKTFAKVASLQLTFTLFMNIIYY